MIKVHVKNTGDLHGNLLTMTIVTKWNKSYPRLFRWNKYSNTIIVERFESGWKYVQPIISLIKSNKEIELLDERA